MDAGEHQEAAHPVPNNSADQMGGAAQTQAATSAPVHQPVHYARHYAAQRIPVFPAGKKKRPILKRGTALLDGSEGGHGFHDATLDPAQISDWWTTYPNALIAYATGDLSGIWIFDFDVKPDKKTGESISLEEHYCRINERTGVDLTEVVTVELESLSGGRHLLFRASPGSTPDSCQNVGGLAKVDIKGNKGYAFLPNGQKGYRWVPGREPWQVAIAEAPPALVALAHEGGSRQRRDKREPSFLDKRPQGNGSAALPDKAGDASSKRNIASALANISRAPSWNEYEDAKLRSALGFKDANARRVWDPDDGYEIWGQTIAPALASTGWGAKAESIFIWWSKQTTIDGLYPGDDECREKLQSFKRARSGDSITEGTIYRKAIDAGWEAPPRSQLTQQPPLRETPLKQPPSQQPPFQGGAQPPNNLLIVSSASFVGDFVPPDYLLDGVLQRRFFYSLTGRTGSGKTALLLLWAAHTALGWPLGHREITKGRVLYFAGENPDDIRMRWIALSKAMGFSVEEIDVHFIPGRFTISQQREIIKSEAAAIGGFVLVIIDTSATYFEGDDENQNVQAGNHARMLRELIDIIPGGPTVIAACHPTKNATNENLTPRGGGAYLAEVDGNLTSIKDDVVIEVHWQGKFRGPEFAPISFRVETKTHPDLKDSRERPIPTVVASYLPTSGQEALAAAALNDANKLLQALASCPGMSYTELARRCEWYVHSGEPNKAKVQRIVGNLKGEKLVKMERSKAVVTPAGRKVLNELGVPVVASGAGDQQIPAANGSAEGKPEAHPKVNAKPKPDPQVKKPDPKIKAKPKRKAGSQRAGGRVV